MNPKNGNSIKLSSSPDRAQSSNQTAQNNSSNGNGNDSNKQKKNYGNFSFDQPVVLKQSSIWAKAIAGTIMGVTAITVIWAATAPFEQVVSATGKLEPIDRVREIKVAVNGRAVVRSVEVENGEKVTKGDTLLNLDNDVTEAQLQSAEQQLESLGFENELYRALINNASSATIQRKLNNLSSTPELLALARNRIALMAENQLYAAQLNGNASQLSREQMIRWRAANAELNTRAAAARLEVRQLQEQLNQTRIQLQDARELLATQTEILNEVEPLLEQGAMGRLRVVNQRQQVQSQKAEVQRLILEQKRLLFSIDQAQRRLENTLDITEKDVLDKTGENKKNIAQIDSQITARLVENKRRIAELKAQIQQYQTTLKYQKVIAPVDGTVFDIKVSPQGVLESNQAETILKIVPGDDLIARVYVTNQDIGFVAERFAIAKDEGKELIVDVRIDSFPFSEFGDIKGKVVYIGSDALPPDQINQYYRFPVEIELKSQYLSVRGQRINLQTGMSITGNIKINEHRTVLNVFTELFNDQIEALKRS